MKRVVSRSELGGKRAPRAVLPRRRFAFRGAGFWAGLAGFGALVSLAALLEPTDLAYAWGPKAHQLVDRSAVITLPPAVRPFFQASQSFILDHADDPHQWMLKDPSQRTHHYIYLDKYGLFPYIQLPYSYKLAVGKYGGRRINSNGTLPWTVGEYSLRLTNDFQEQKWEVAKLDAAILAYYVAESHDPMNTTQNFDGQLTGQKGLSVRFGSSLVERYANFFMLHPEAAAKVDDPTNYAFQMAIEANTWVDRILWADWRSRAGLSDYTDEYFDRFYTQIGSTAMQEIDAATHDTGSYWYTAWLNAGQPALPTH